MGKIHDDVNYSHLHNHCELDEEEEDEEGDDHVYYDLEKPGGDDYEDPDKDETSAGAIEYEVPARLK